MLATLKRCIVGAAVIAIASMASGQQLRPIAIGLSSTSLGTAGIRAAKEMGFFAKHGLDAKFTVLDSANAATTALISRSLEAAVAGPTELITAQARGQKVVAIATTYGGLGSSLVLAKNVTGKLGISPTAPVSERLKALDGLLIGAPSATSIATVSIKSAAKAAGANVRFTYMAQPAMLAAPESGAIQGYSASAPFWALPVLKGSGVLWINGPNGELPSEFRPASTGQLHVMRDFAEANPQMIESLVAVFADLAKAIDERPAEVKAAVAKLHPDLDAKTLDFLFPTESGGWKAKPPTPKDIAHDIAFTKLTGAPLPQIDSTAPASMLFPETTRIRKRHRQEGRMRKLSLFLGCLAAAAAAAMSATVFAQQPREFTIGLPSRSLVAAPPRVAKEMGLFEKYGLNPKFVVLDSANAATGALISKSVDVAISGLVEVVAAQARGQKVVVIANSYTGLSGSLVLSKAVADKLGVSPNAPVAQRLKALDGLLIGSASATSSFTIAYRGSAQATGANVRFTYMALPAMGAALESGAIQGFVATAPYWTAPVLKGSGVLWISAPKGELPPENSTASGANYQTMRDFAEKNPDLVKRFVAVMNELSKAIEERPSEVKAAIAKLYPDLDAATIDLLYGLESPAWKAKPVTANDVAHEIRFLKSGGAQLPDTDKLDLNSMLLTQ